MSPACTGSNGELNEVKLSWLELLGCILTLRENLPFLATDPQLLGCILTLRENLPFLATDLFIGWSAELCYAGPRYLFLGWSAELCYTGPRYLFLRAFSRIGSAELCY